MSAAQQQSGPADLSLAGGGRTIWFTGLPSSGKTTLANAVAARLRAAGHRVEVLDGDALRTHLTRDLGFSRQDRGENVRRVGYVAHLLSRNGVVAMCALISPYRTDRDGVRAMHGDRFVEVYVSAPVEVCAQRDVKGLFAKQRAGAMHGLTGIDDPYEAPTDPEVSVPTHRQTVQESVEQILRALSTL